VPDADDSTETSSDDPANPEEDTPPTDEDLSAEEGSDSVSDSPES
jgi:hypothetical protein